MRTSSGQQAHPFNPPPRGHGEPARRGWKRGWCGESSGNVGAAGRTGGVWGGVTGKMGNTGEVGADRGPKDAAGEEASRLMVCWENRRDMDRMDWGVLLHW